jgi:hypothetical protein
MIVVSLPSLLGYVFTSSTLAMQTYTDLTM